MTQYLLSMPHDSAEEPTMATMDPAELEAAMAAAGTFLEELSTSGALLFAGGVAGIGHGQALLPRLPLLGNALRARLPAIATGVFPTFTVCVR